MQDYREWQNFEIFLKCGVPKERICLALANNGNIEKTNWEIWAANATDARKYDVPFISDLYNTKRGSCVVCGAGPSLHKHTDELRELHRQGYDFIATDRALSDVREILRGGKELLSVTCECQPECGDFLNAASEGDTVVVGMHSCAETRAKLVERGCNMYHMAYMCPSPAFSEFVNNMWGRDVSCVRTGYIVGFSAVDIAYWLGYGQDGSGGIYTIGNDLCYESPFTAIEDTAILPDGGNGYIRRLKDGRWTFRMFEEAASDFSNFLFWDKDVKFGDFSGGIMQWPQRDIRELAGAAVAVPA